MTGKATAIPIGLGSDYSIFWQGKKKEKSYMCPKLGSKTNWLEGSGKS